MAELNLQNLKDFVEEQLKDTDCFLVKAEILKGKDILVEIDSDSRVDIDFVGGLNQAIEANFAPEIDDYNLEVGSVGLTSPLKLPRQFRKNVGNDVEVLTRDGRKLHGMLKSADEEGFVLITREKVKKEGEKRPVTEDVEYPFAYGDVKSVTYEIKF
ncbi:MAG: ribosome assembly cofactor RimP [Muribaculaceae bacterium]|nr:ribosome assembly cofactor RimP [Muribaculaceae bacterium]